MLGNYKMDSMMKFGDSRAARRSSGTDRLRLTDLKLGIKARTTRATSGGLKLQCIAISNFSSY